MGYKQEFMISLDTNSYVATTENVYITLILGEAVACELL